MVRVLNVRLALAGIAEERRRKIALNWAMIKIVPEQGRAVQVKPATANINLALAILVINILARVPAIPAARALLVEVSTPPAPAPAAMNGKMVVAKYTMVKLLVIYITAMAPWLGLRLQVWASI